MRPHFRRRRQRLAWNWAASGTLSITDSGTTPGNFVSTAGLLPPARVDWLLESGRGRNHITVHKMLLWLNFWISNNTGAAANMVPEINLWTIKTKFDGNGNAAFYGGIGAGTTAFPYAVPATPNAVASWTSASFDESDGLDPFLWTHAIFPAQFTSNAQLAANTQTPYPNAATVAARPAYQPDVVISSKRRLEKGESILFGISNPGNGLNTLISYNVSWRVRVLTS